MRLSAVGWHDRSVLGEQTGDSVNPVGPSFSSIPENKAGLVCGRRRLQRAISVHISCFSKVFELWDRMWIRAMSTKFCLLSQSPITSLWAGETYIFEEQIRWYAEIRSCILHVSNQG